MVATVTVVLPEGGDHLTWRVDITGGRSDGAQREVNLTDVFGQHVADAVSDLMAEVKDYCSQPRSDWSTA